MMPSSRAFIADDAVSRQLPLIFASVTWLVTSAPDAERPRHYYADSERHEAATPFFH
jgi:hypothetical protein